MEIVEGEALKMECGESMNIKDFEEEEESLGKQTENEQCKRIRENGLTSKERRRGFEGISGRPEIKISKLAHWLWKLGDCSDFMRYLWNDMGRSQIAVD